MLSLSSLKGLPDFIDLQRVYNWEIVLPDLYGLLVTGWFVSKYVQSVDFGQYAFKTVSEQRSGPYLSFFPDELEIPSLEMIILVPVPDIITLYLQTWKNKIVDKEGFYYPASNYKKSSYILMYDRTGLPVNIVAINNMWPVSFPMFKLDYSSEDVVRFNVSFKYESVKFGIDAIAQGIGGAGQAVKDFAGKIGSKLGSIGGTKTVNIA